MVPFARRQRRGIQAGLMPGVRQHEPGRPRGGELQDVILVVVQAGVALVDNHGDVPGPRMHLHPGRNRHGFGNQRRAGGYADVVVRAVEVRSLAFHAVAADPGALHHAMVAVAAAVEHDPAAGLLALLAALELEAQGHPAGIAAAAGVGIAGGHQRRARDLRPALQHRIRRHAGQFGRRGVDHRDGLGGAGRVAAAVRGGPCAREHPGTVARRGFLHLHRDRSGIRLVAGHAAHGPDAGDHPGTFPIRRFQRLHRQRTAIHGRHFRGRKGPVEDHCLVQISALGPDGAGMASQHQQAGRGRVERTAQFAHAAAGFAVHVKLVPAVAVVDIRQVMPDPRLHLGLAERHAAVLGEVVLIAVQPPIQPQPAGLVPLPCAVGEHAGRAVRKELVQFDPDRHRPRSVAARQAGIRGGDGLAVVVEAERPAPRAVRHPAGPVHRPHPAMPAGILHNRSQIFVEGIIQHQVLRKNLVAATANRFHVRRNGDCIARNSYIPHRSVKNQLKGIRQGLDFLAPRAPRETQNAPDHGQWLFHRSTSFLQAIPPAPLFTYKDEGESRFIAQTHLFPSAAHA